MLVEDKQLTQTHNPRSCSNSFAQTHTHMYKVREREREYPEAVEGMEWADGEEKPKLSRFHFHLHSYERFGAAAEALWISVEEMNTCTHTFVVYEINEEETFKVFTHLFLLVSSLQ